MSDIMTKYSILIEVTDYSLTHDEDGNAQHKVFESTTIEIPDGARRNQMIGFALDIMDDMIQIHESDWECIGTYFEQLESDISNAEYSIDITGTAYAKFLEVFCDDYSIRHYVVVTKEEGVLDNTPQEYPYNYNVRWSEPNWSQKQGVQ